MGFFSGVVSHWGSSPWGLAGGLGTNTLAFTSRDPELVFSCRRAGGGGGRMLSWRGFEALSVETGGGVFAGRVSLAYNGTTTPVSKGPDGVDL